MAMVIYSMLFLCSIAVHTAAQQDTITGIQYSRWYFADGSDNTANCGHFTCTGNSRLNDPVQNNRMYVSMHTPIYKGTIITGSTVTVPALQVHFSVTYTYNLTGFEEYSYTVHISNFTESLAGFYYCRLGSAAPKRARPELLYRSNVTPPKHSCFSSSTSVTLRMSGMQSTYPHITELRVRSNNWSKTISTAGLDSFDIDLTPRTCDQVFLDYGLEFHSYYPCGYMLGRKPVGALDRVDCNSNSTAAARKAATAAQNAATAAKNAAAAAQNAAAAAQNAATATQNAAAAAQNAAAAAQNAATAAQNAAIAAQNDVAAA